MMKAVAELASVQWTIAEDALIKKHNGNLEVLIVLLKDRSKDGIRKRRSFLGLGPAVPSPWSSDEDQLLIRLYPDFSAIEAGLSCRTKAAIKSRIRKLEIEPAMHPWLGSELQYMLDDNGRSSVEELLEKFQRHTATSISTVRYRIGVKLHRPCAPRSGIFGEIIARAAAIPIGLSELGRRVSKNTTTFHVPDNHPGRPTCRELFDATAILGGELYVEWED